MSDTPEQTNKAVVFHDADMQTSFSNVANVAAGHEEFALLFGISRSWHGKGDKFDVDLGHRIIMSPRTAKRLTAMLVNALSQHEARFGKIDAMPDLSAEQPTQQ